MRPHHLFFSILTLVLLVFLFGMSFLTTGAYFAQNLRFYLSDTMQNSPSIFLYTSSIFFLLGVFLLIGFTSLQKNRFLKIKVKPHSFSINPAILSHSIQTIMKKYLSDNSVSVEVILLPSKKLEVISYLPDIEGDAKESFLNWAQSEISSHLQKKYGYFKDFSLVLYYQ